MPVTARDVATACGVSVTTVNEILGGRGERYREETRERVRATAESLGYRRHGMAQAVRTGRFNAVALIGASEEGPIHRHQLMAGVAERLAEAGSLLQLAWLPRDSLADAPRLVREWCSDGMLINLLNPIADRFVEQIRSHRIPSVWINSDVPEDSVRPDDIGGAAMAVRHLAAAGHRRIAWIEAGGTTPVPGLHVAHEHRRDGYRAAMTELGLVPRFIQNEVPTGPQDLVDLAARALHGSDAPDACATPDGQLAAALIHVACTAGREPPELVVMEDAPVIALGRRLATCLVPQRTMGTVATEMLLARIAGAPPQPARVIPFDFNPGIP
jgi:LacI family transcriptional regulator